MFKTNVEDENGKFIELDNREAAHALMLQRKYNTECRNSLGFDIPITTLTAISKSITEQRFFEINPADYMPIRVGDGAWSDQIVTYRSFAVGGDFEEGNINEAADNSRLAETDAGVDAMYNKIVSWGKQVTWSFPQLKFAAKSGNWDLVSAKEKSRKINWDLGIQKIAFLGSSNDPAVMGLLTQSAVTSNTSLLSGYINAMNASQFQGFVASLLEAYRANAQRTIYPTKFIIPEADWNGLGTLVPSTTGMYPVPMLNYLLEAFRLITRNPKFEIMPCAYCDEINNASSINLNRYVLLNEDPDSVRMDVPVPYSNTLQNTINGFQFQNVGYGQYTGVLAYRPLEMLYIDHHV